jgi:NAD(P)-dependent dehydrogenase (short-subunit alcohol dehydrogenase family)
MELGLEGRVAVVTGASRGIGRAIAGTLIGEGMRVVLVARSHEPLDAMAREWPAALVHRADLTDPLAPAAIVADTLARLGRLDLVVNNAGAAKRGDFFSLTDEDWEDGFRLKLFAAVRLSRVAWAELARRKGAIVNIAGIGGRTGSATFTVGGAVNAAMLNLTKALADRGVHDGVRVNAVNPGSIETDRLTARVATLATAAGISDGEARARMLREQGIPRFGTPGEIGAVVAFLASERAAHMNGAVVDVDGGQTRTL